MFPKLTTRANRMNSRWTIVAALSLMSFSCLPATAAAEASPCGVEHLYGTEHLVCQTRSTGGKLVRAEFKGAIATEATDTARICSEPMATLREAVLWMPDHGHGSTAPRLSMEADGCTLLTDVNFSMPGLWQIKLRFADNDRAIIELEVFE